MNEPPHTDPNAPRPKRSHGDGRFDDEQFARLGQGVVFERDVLVFHPETIEIDDHVYVGHQTILKGYYKGQMRIGAGTWIGQQCFFHSAGGLTVGRNVGVGPGVRIITSTHKEQGRALPILHAELEFAAVDVADDCDLGVSCVLLPGTKLGRGVIVGAGAVVKGTFDDYSVVAGVPARVVKTR